VLTRPVPPVDAAVPWRERVELDEAQLVGLCPDLIIASEGLGGGVDPAAVHAAARLIGDRTGRPPRVVMLTPETVEDMLDDVLRVGEAIGRANEASEAVVRLRGRFHAAQDYVNPYTPGPIVGFVTWTDPILVPGGWTVQLIERAGGRHPLNATAPRPGTGTASGPQQGERGAGPPLQVSDEGFAAAAPEVLIIASRGRDLPGARESAAALAGRPWFGSLPAVRSGRVAIVDGRTFDRPGPGLADAFEFLVGFIQHRSELIPPGFPWEPLHGE
jgi:iron complex transport system substrate-binding protein